MINRVVNALMPHRVYGRRARLRLAARHYGFVLLCALPLSASLLTLSSSLNAQPVTAEVSEERVEAAYLYKFLNYVEWPASSFASDTAPYVIGVIGADPVANELTRITAGKVVDNRTVSVRRLAAGDTLTDLDVLFISRSERTSQTLLRQVRAQPVLTVTESEGALEQGSIVNFRIVDRSVRFEVSLDAAERAGLKLSARLLGVAINVVKGSR